MVREPPKHEPTLLDVVRQFAQASTTAVGLEQATPPFSAGDVKNEVVLDEPSHVPTTVEIVEQSRGAK